MKINYSVFYKILFLKFKKILKYKLFKMYKKYEFIKFYIGNEINPNLKKFLDTNPVWKQFFSKNKDQFKKLLELTDAFGRGKENIDAIMAQYDNYIK